ncbi:MAG TPA: CheR family methyltransferase, partial [Terriglobia bacterium]|nr:CheR family methyltransferase [Terriglobia bacterium]
DSLEAYTSHLQRHRDEVDALFQDMLIHVTGFFRDPDVFEALKREVFPNLVKDRPAGTPIRVWISGCSTGEEAYSVAMVLLEFLSEISVNYGVQIFATDVNEAALEKARQGEYLESIATDVSPERLRRFFMKMPHGYRINKSVRDLCIFARHDIGKDPPFSRLDLITCRNLLIYLGPVLQKRILPIFHYALKATGYLLLGSSETIGTFAEYFSLVDKKHKLYRARPGARSHIMDLGERASADVGPARRETEPELNDNFDWQKEANRILLTRFSPPGVIIDDEFKVVHFHGRTGRYLEPAPGNASLNLARMAREGLHVDLRAAVQEARRSHHPVTKRGVLMKQNAHMVGVDIEVIPIKGPAASMGYCLVLFQDAAPAPAATEPGKAAKGPKGKLVPAKSARREISQLKDELGQTRRTLQSTIEELEATNEELRSANEEGLSSNEELQSTNEELETAKEELQSANEELTTLNEELQNRNHALNIVNNDLINLLGSVDIPILMLAGDLRIRRFTPSAQKLMNIVNADIGRPLGDIKLKFELPGFEKLIAEAI